MQAKVTWSEGLTFEGQADTGFKLPLGASPSVGGDDDGFRPMELIAIGIIGCTAMDVISILQKKRQEITEFIVDLEASRAEEHPKVFTNMAKQYIACFRQQVLPKTGRQLSRPLAQYFDLPFSN